VHVSAKDRGTGKEQSMTISGGSSLSKDEIDRMIKDAEAHADEDRKRREDAEVRNSAEQLAYTTEKFLADNDEKLPEDGKQEVRTAIGELRTALAGDDINEVKGKQENLATASQKLGAALYAQNEQGGAAAGAADGDEPADATRSSADDDVVDAEIVDEDK
jgi:molecular chaperone DnaK